MIRKSLVILLILQFQSVLGQKTLEQIIDTIPLYKNYYSPFSYYDSAEKKQGFSIQNESQILEKLSLEPLNHGEYRITGKYEINNLLVLFFSKYWISEDVHFALLLDESLNVIDRLDETAYNNDEGFYSSHSYLSYNILTTATTNIYNNPEHIRNRYTITNRGFIPVKNQVIIKTPSGIRVRQKPTTDSPIVTMAPNLEIFDYLSQEGEIDSTSVIEKGKYLKSTWIEIAITDSTQQLGYVFGAFVKRHIELITNDYKVTLDEISKEDFQQEEKKEISHQNIVKITTIKEIESILKKQLIRDDSEEEYYLIQKIVADNGKVISDYLDECGIIAYFPEFNYLLMECGHSSDYLIDLKNGMDDVNRIGNPDYYLPSPKNTFRLNGYYSGQSNVHFLEKNNREGLPEYLLHFSSLIPLDYIEKYFWTDDRTMVLKIEKEYYKLQLQKI